MNHQRKRILLIILALLQCLSLCACAAGTGSVTDSTEETVPEHQQWLSRPLNVIDDKYRTYYEIFVYSLCDSDGDGIGDLNGVTQKLDYIQDLGFNGIWLMPIMPSPTYHKYDTTDYMQIDPAYGTLEDFTALLEECHARGIRVIIDLAMNHTSDSHPWFEKAMIYLSQLPEGTEPSAEECPYVDYYHFSREPASGYTQLGSGWYYESQFWSGMPDLNLKSEAVRSEFEAIADFWIGLGVDGFRLDAVKEFYSGDINSNIEVLTWFNSYVKSISEDQYIVCECWDAKSTYSQYYASGVDSMFDFSFGERSGIITNTLLGKYPASAYGEQMAENEALYASFSDSYINAPFYTNHDMGRTTGYYFSTDGEAQTKMGNAMNLMMTGNVFVYYGEELGMKGSGKDENKRAPMYWSKDPDSEGMCDGPKDMDDFEMKYDSLQEQQNDPESIYSYVKQAILLRNQNPEIARGTISVKEAYSGEQLCVMTKSYQGREILLVFNTTNTSAAVSLEGLTVQGTTVEELSVLGELLTGSESVVIDGNHITMPAFSILVMGLENA